MSSALPFAQSLVTAETTTQRLTRIWEDLLGVKPIEPDQNYFDLGGDSLLAVQMFTQIEKVFEVKLPVASLFDAPTIGELSAILDREAPPMRWSSLVPIQTKGTRPAFFCMHGAGGNVLIYRELSQRLGEDQPFYGLQSQGLDGSTEPQKRIEDMAATYVKEIRRAQPKGPYYLGGYCLGGTIAYEVARQIRAQGEPVAMVAMFDTQNWCKVPPPTSWDKTVMSLERIVFHARNFFRLNGEGRSVFFRDKLQALRNRIPVWRGMLMNRFASRTEKDETSNSQVLGTIWAANDFASMEYQPQAYDGAITDFRPIKQYSLYQRPDLKWETLALGGQNTVQLPVYPAGMLVEPFVGTLADALRAAMDTATKKSVSK
jgi:phthiocerol/phenolphthiocerol synthesis type-I polyketide synthase E